VRADPDCVFVYDFVQLEVSFEDVKRRLCRGEAQWLAPLAAAAYREGEATVVSLGLKAGARRLSAPFRYTMTSTGHKSRTTLGAAAIRCFLAGRSARMAPEPAGPPPSAAPRRRGCHSVAV
jgi:hypothetical protein